MSTSMIAFLLAIAMPVLAEDGPIVVDGITFESVTEYFQSDYFKEHGKRCGTVVDNSVMGEPQDRGNPWDCGVITNPEDEYEPDVTLRIQVVVHIITHANGYGDLTDEQVQSQIDVLNEDYQAILGSPGEDGHDIKLEFYLATEDPDGNPTNGITRTANTDWFGDNGNYYLYLNWDPTRYMNIYTNNPGGGILGYVPWLPHQGAPGSAADRVVIWYRVFGRPGNYPPYDGGRTCTHEVGHYFGLMHTFQSGCGINTPPQCNSTGDTICDTNNESTAHYGCYQTYTCGTPDPIENYMNYTDDICMTSFTQEQARRVRCTIEHYRPDLPQPVTAVDEQPAQVGSVALYQNVPNPFNPKTQIRFELAESGSAAMQIIDVTGRVIRGYELGALGAGSHELSWDGKNDQGQAMSSGVYFYRLSVENEDPVTKRMLLLK